MFVLYIKLCSSCKSSIFVRRNEADSQLFLVRRKMLWIYAIGEFFALYKTLISDEKMFFNFSANYQ